MLKNNYTVIDAIMEWTIANSNDRLRLKRKNERSRVYLNNTAAQNRFIHSF